MRQSTYCLYPVDATVYVHIQLMQQSLHVVDMTFLISIQLVQQHPVDATFYLLSAFGWCNCLRPRPLMQQSTYCLHRLMRLSTSTSIWRDSIACGWSNILILLIIVPTVRLMRQSTYCLHPVEATIYLLSASNWCNCLRPYSVDAIVFACG